MKFVIVTNNPKVRDELGQEFDVDYADITYREILCKVRDMIYEGHKLLTHPLSRNPVQIHFGRKEDRQDGCAGRIHHRKQYHYCGQVFG